MSTITTRAGKDSALTHNQLDTNFKKAAQAKTGAYTVAESDNRDTIECSGTFTVTLPDVATVVAAADTGDFEVTIKNTGTGIITIARTTGADTIDGTAANKIMSSNESLVIKANNAGNGYVITANKNPDSVTVNASGSSELVGPASGLGGTEYIVEAYLFGNAATAFLPSVVINGDTTATNYYRLETGATTATNTNSIDIGTTATTEYIDIRGRISISDNGLLIFEYTPIRASTTNNALLAGGNIYNIGMSGTKTSVTSLQFDGNNASSLPWDSTSYVKMTKVK